MKQLFKQLSGKGLELSQGARTWIFILLAIAMGTGVLTVLMLSPVLRVFSGILFEDIAVTVNLAMGIFFSAIFAEEISSALHKGEAKNCNSPFGMMNFLWGRMIAGFISVIPFFLISGTLFLLIYSFLLGSLDLRLIQSQISSMLALIPLIGIATAVAIWFKPSPFLHLTLAGIYFIAFFAVESIPLILTGIIPNMDFYQTDTRLFHKTHGSWLYIFSLMGIGFVWTLSCTSISGILHNCSKGFKKYPNDHKGIRPLMSKVVIAGLSLFFGIYISSGLRSIERIESESVDSLTLIPKVGLKGIFADFHYMQLNELYAKNDLVKHQNILENIEKHYSECVKFKPAFESINKNAFFLISSFPSATYEERNRLSQTILNNYMNNSFITKDRFFEYNAVYSFMNPANPERDKYMGYTINTLRIIAKNAPSEIKSTISKKIVALNAERMGRSAWAQNLTPINKEYAELLVWYREWKHSISMKHYEPIDEIKKIEENIIKAADNAEKTSYGNVNILASVENIRRNIYLAKYVKSNKYYNF